MPPKKKAGLLYKRAEPIPKNTVFTDLKKQKWIIGTSIGVGGFGDIYCAAEGDTPPKKDTDYIYVVKVEPVENGPLFVERAFYMRVSKKEDVEKWKSDKKLKTFGMPTMYSHGTEELNGVKNRFMVIDRYSKDLGSLLTKCDNVFPLSTVLRICVQVLDVLEYIHSKDYMHGDIKAANLLLGFKKGTENQVYVIDFGLACRLHTGEYKRDPRRAHNGTLEYASRDAHFGIPTRRSDLEILAYNVIQWLSSKLPWVKLTDCAAVEMAKHEALSDVRKFLTQCFGKKPVPDVVLKFVTYVTGLKHNDVPDYSKLRQIFLDGLKAEGCKLDGALVFTKPEEQENTINKANRRVRSSPRKTAKSQSTSSDVEYSSPPRSASMQSDSDRDMFSPTPPKRKVVAKKVADSSKAKKAPKKAVEEPVKKPSWRDCPTVQASGVTRPGEFIPNNKGVDSKRRKKE